VQVNGLLLLEKFYLPPQVSSSHVYVHKMVKQLIDLRKFLQVSSKVIEAATCTFAFEGTRFGEL